jgi:hypothetical protein
MTKTIKGDLILKKDTIFDESIKVEGNIEGEFNLTVKGNIDAWDIDAEDIYAMNIDAGDIDAQNIVAQNIDASNIYAGNIVAMNIDANNIYAKNIDAQNIVAENIDAKDIDAWDIDAQNIVCISRKKKSKDVKTIAYSIILDRYNRDRKEVMPE